MAPSAGQSLNSPPKMSFALNSGSTGWPDRAFAKRSTVKGGGRGNRERWIRISVASISLNVLPAASQAVVMSPPISAS